MQGTPARFLDRRTPPHLATLIAMTAVSSLAMSMFLPSLPAMARHFGADYGLLQLSVSIYLLGSAALQLLVGPLSDRYGRRPVLLGGIAIFILASAGCLAADTIAGFLAWRLVQATIVTGLVLARAMVRDTHGQSESAAMIGWVMTAMSVVPLVGPAVGGWLDATFGWKANFATLLILGVLLAALVWADAGETARTVGRPVAAQFREYPELLGSPRFWGYALCAGLASGGFFAFLGGGPWVGEHVYAMSSQQVGIALGSPACGYVVGNYLTARLSVALGVNRMMLAGCMISAAGLAAALLMVLAGVGGAWPFFAGTAVMAGGNGMTLPNAVAGTMSVRPRLAGSAAGLGGALQIASGALMAVLAGELLIEGGGPVPLLLLMLGSALLSLLAIIYVIRRTAALPG